MSPVENMRFNALMNAISRFKEADEKVVEIFRIFPATALRKPEHVATMNQHIDASEAMVTAMSTWAEQAQKVGYYPTEGEQVQLLDILEKARYEYRFFSIYYNKFQLESDPTGTYMITGELVDQGKLAIDRIKEAVQSMDEEN